MPIYKLKILLWFITYIFYFNVHKLVVLEQKMNEIIRKILLL